MAKDKKLHVIAGTVIALVAILLTGIPLAGLFAALAAGVGKEMWDLHQNKLASKKNLVPPHSVEVDDVAYTVAPGAILAIGFSLYWNL